MAHTDGKMEWDDIVGGSRSTHRPPTRADVARAQKRSRSGSGSTRAQTKKKTRGARPSSSPRKTAPTGSKRKAKGEGRQRSLGRKIGLGIVLTILGITVVGIGAFLYLYATLKVPAVDDMALAQTTTVYYADGTTEMGKFQTVDRQVIDSSTLPDYVAHAVVASEDRSFYTNSGIDFKGIFRALINNVTTGTRQGGSTLTQQYVERYYMGETTSYKGKVKEAVLAVKINREQTKDEIIGNYLNTIYFGRGAYGIEAAAQAYFAHPAAELTLSEAALLAGIIPAPSSWDPAVDSDQAKSRWKRVLKLMVEDGWISQSEADKATFPETVEPNTQTEETMSGPNGYLMEQVRQELIATGGFTEEEVLSGGLKITSTIDKARQDAAVAAATSMTEVEGWDPVHMHTALSSVDPSNGEIVAEYAGADYLKRQQNAVTQDIAMAGSSFKPFSLLAHVRKGGSIRETFNGNSPETFDGLTDPVQNNDGISWGTVDLKAATQNSINTAFVELNEKIGPASTRQAAVDAGIPEDTVGLDDTLLNVLGFAAVHNIDLATAYATFANGGNRVTPHIVRAVSDYQGNKVYDAPTSVKQVFTAEEVSSVLPALEAVTTTGGSAQAVSVALPDIASGGKTGTSSQQLSAQFAGFVPGLVTAVSMYQSDDNGNSVPLKNIGGLSAFYGADWPVDVWVKYMKVATSSLPDKDFTWRVKIVDKYQPQYQAPVQEEPQPEEEAPEPAPEQPQQETPTLPEENEDNNNPNQGDNHAPGTGGYAPPGEGSGGNGGTGANG
ncbi:transglycosylase domain-containing protein [Schaalia sp. ZJ405]|uniref:transglycosylase domain-containing protein n=1 Tax=Schaalia sp. ZJ405 TaxID=2709403 RepID=UPI001E3F3B22|nr:transglycosylase domain-containing protein [Schaalia sp. ZJ405]